MAETQAEWEVLMMTSTSSKVVLLLITLAIVTFNAAAPHNDGGGDFGLQYSDTGFSVPDYDTHAEIVTMFVAPFLFVSLLLQLALYTVFRSTILNDNYMSREERRAEKKKVRKASTIMAMAITGMLVVTPFWNLVILMSSTIGLIAVGTVLVVFLLIFAWSSGASAGNGRRDE